MTGCEHCKRIKPSFDPPGMTAIGKTTWEALFRCDFCGGYRWRTRESRLHGDYEVWSRPYRADIEQFDKFVSEQMKIENKSKDEVVEKILRLVVYP